MALSQEQAIERIQSKCKEKNYKFKGFVGGTWKGNTTKLVLECPNHGEWDSTTYKNFINNGRGCTSCCANKRITACEAIERIQSKCKEKNYTFKGFVGGTWKGNTTKLILECPEHGIWDSTSYASFIRNIGCTSCSGNKRITVEQAIERIEIKCKEKNYTFKGFVGGWKGNTTKLILECHEHGIWDSTSYASFINNGIDCPSCSGSKKLTVEQAIERIEIKCKEKNYTFKGFVGGWKGAKKTKLILECPEHGEWNSATYVSFISLGRGCPKCHDCGYDPQKQGMFYIVRWTHPVTRHSFIKFGITNHTDYMKRINTQARERHTEYKPEVLEAGFYLSGEVPPSIEKVVHSKLKTGVIDKSLFGDGYTETVEDTPENLSFIRSLMNTTIPIAA